MKRTLDSGYQRSSKVVNQPPDLPTTLADGPRLQQVCKTIEADPHSLDPHQPGAKLDAGKVRMGLVMQGFTRALFEVGRVGTQGRNTPRTAGWKFQGATWTPHTGIWPRDELNPFDTGTTLFHLAQAAWNLLAVLELRLRKWSNEPLQKPSSAVPQGTAWRS